MRGENEAMVLQPENAVILDVRKSSNDWCVFEYWATLKEGEPPQCIMCGAERLIDVYKLRTGKSNTEFARIFANGGTIMVRIIAIGGSRRELIQAAVMQTRKYTPAPVCNTKGYTAGGIIRRISCSDGRIFDSQQHCAVELGVSQSAISRHLRGEGNHVKGYLLTYAGIE